MHVIGAITCALLPRLKSFQRFLFLGVWVCLCWFFGFFFVLVLGIFLCLRKFETFLFFFFSNAFGFFAKAGHAKASKLLWEQVCFLEELQPSHASPMDNSPPPGEGRFSKQRLSSPVGFLADGNSGSIGAMYTLCLSFSRLALCYTLHQHRPEVN
jgi:hypothetical protein